MAAEKATVDLRRRVTVHGWTKLRGASPHLNTTQRQDLSVLPSTVHTIHYTLITHTQMFNMPAFVFRLFNARRGEG